MFLFWLMFWEPCSLFRVHVGCQSLALWVFLRRPRLKRKVVRHGKTPPADQRHGTALMMSWYTPQIWDVEAWPDKTQNTETPCLCPYTLGNSSSRSQNFYFPDYWKDSLKMKFEMTFFPAFCFPELFGLPEAYLPPLPPLLGTRSTWQLLQGYFGVGSLWIEWLLILTHTGKITIL